MITTKNRFQLTALLLCLVMLCCYFSGSTPARADDTSLTGLQSQAQQINNRLQELENEKKQIQEKIKGTKSKLEEERQTKSYLDQQIAITKEEIELIEEKIENLNQEIEIKIGNINDKQAEHDQNYELFRQRLRAMYMYGDATMLGLLFGTESFADFLSKTDTITRIADHDRTLMQKLTNERIELEAQQADLESRRQDQEDLRVEAQEKRDTLTVQMQAAAIRIQDVSDLQAQFTADLAKAEAEAKAMEADLADIYRKIEWASNPYIGGEMRWPVDNFPKISSYYGLRFGGKDFHTGIDIYGTGIYNQPVRAANAGTVKLANWSYTPGRGYGIYVIIDHGGKISTLYGHLCNITVQVGDVVQRGEQIGNVGSTGWSTGPHLHFEIRENGVHKDPLSYLKG